ncbi:MAG: transposase [Chloroflexota bacterium]
MTRLAARHPEWVLGYEDETWWSRLARPALCAWTGTDKPLHLVEQAVPKGDPDPKALAAYGFLVRLLQPDGMTKEEVWLRFVDGRPISGVTTQFLEWICERLESLGKRALLLAWDNAPWHVSREVRTWLGEHNRRVKREGKGVRIIACYLPIKSPWLNPIEPRWIHAKRKVVEPDRLLSAEELADRVCAHFHCQHDVHLDITEDVV